MGRIISAVRRAAAMVLVAALPMPAAALASSAKGKSRSCADVNLRPTSTNTARIDAATLCLIDRARVTYHLRALRANRELQSVANAKTTSMLSRDYFSDNSPSGQSPAALIAATAYGAHASSLSTAEDLGWGTLADATPTGIVTAWMHSPAHREIILTATFRDAGVGVVPAVPSVIAPSAPGATYAVEFGVRG